MAAAVQQLNVRLQQQGTMATILQAERVDLARQVQSATSTTTQRQPGDVDTRMIGRTDKFDGDPMKYADRLFTLRSSFGAVDQRYQLYYTLVMTTIGSALNKCHNASEKEGLAWRQFVMDWEPKLVGLLMNVLSHRLEDVPTKSAASERLVHESQSSETFNDDTKTGVTVLEMEDMRAKAHLIRNSARIASWTQTREDILEITRTQQYTDSKPVPMQIGAHPKRKARAKKARTRKAEARARIQRTSRQRK